MAKDCKVSRYTHEIHLKRYTYITGLGEVPCAENDETVCYKWDQPGLQSNFYWEEKTSRIPRRLFQQVHHLLFVLLLSNSLSTDRQTTINSLIPNLSVDLLSAPKLLNCRNIASMEVQKFLHVQSLLFAPSCVDLFRHCCLSTCLGTDYDFELKNIDQRILLLVSYILESLSND